MNISKRRNSHLSTISTARSIGGLFIVLGFVMLILSVTIGILLFQTDIKGVDADTLLDSVSPAAEQQVDDESTITRTDVIRDSLDAQNIKSTASKALTALEWDDFWKLVTGTFMILWLGYVLRVMAVLAETQLIDFQKID